MTALPIEKFFWIGNVISFFSIAFAASGHYVVGSMRAAMSYWKEMIHFHFAFSSAIVARVFMAFKDLSPLSRSQRGFSTFLFGSAPTFGILTNSFVLGSMFVAVIVCLTALASFLPFFRSHGLFAAFPFLAISLLPFCFCSSSTNAPRDFSPCLLVFVGVVFLPFIRLVDVPLWILLVAKTTVAFLTPFFHAPFAVCGSAINAWFSQNDTSLEMYGIREL